MVIGGGGFFFESLSLLKKIRDENEVNIIIPSDSQLLKQRISEVFDTPMIVDVMPAVTTVSLSKVQQGVNFMKCLLVGAQLLNNIKPDVVIVVASSMAVPLFMIARLFKIKTVFIDSITRVNKASKTGLIVSRYKLVDRFYVQWPDAVHLYPDALYEGTVL